MLQPVAQIAEAAGEHQSRPGRDHGVHATLIPDTRVPKPTSRHRPAGPDALPKRSRRLPPASCPIAPGRVPDRGPVRWRTLNRPFSATRQLFRGRRSSRNPQSNWIPVVDSAGVAKAARLYELRSTLASKALAAGITRFELARIMGTS